MSLRMRCNPTSRAALAALLLGVAVAQTPVSSVTVVQGDTTLTARFARPFPSTGITAYTVTARPFDVPLVQPLTTIFSDTFAGPAGLAPSAANWVFTNGTCPLNADALPKPPCWTRGPNNALLTGSNSFALTLGQRQFQQATTNIQTLQDLGRNGIPYLQRVASAIGEVFRNGARVYSVTVNADTFAPALTGNYTQSGLAVFDNSSIAVGRSHRTVLRLFVRYFDSTSVNNAIIYRVYTESGGRVSYTNTIVTTTVVFPVELYIARERSNAGWTLGYRNANDAYLRVVGVPASRLTWTPTIIADTALWSYSPSTSYVGIFGENWGFTVRTAFFSNFRHISRDSWDVYNGNVTAEAVRNNTINLNGVCSVSRTVVSVVPNNLANYAVVLRGLINGLQYFVYVTSNTATAASTATYAPGLTEPRPTAPATAASPAGAGLWLDSIGIPPRTTYTSWRDISGNNRDFSLSTAGSPSAMAPNFAANELTASIVFPADGTPRQFTQAANDGFGTMTGTMDGNGWTDLQYSWFVVYKPASTTAYWYSSSIISKGPVGGPGWDVVAQYFGSATSAAGIRIYGSAAGGSGLEAGLYRGYQASARTIDPTTQPTLLTYSLQQSGNSLTSYYLTGCAGTSATACSDTAPAGTWTAGFPQDSVTYSLPFQPISAGTGSAIPSTPFAYDLNLAANWQSNAAVAMTISQGSGSTVNHFRGSLYVIMVYAGTMTTDERTTVQNYLSDRYFLRCPAFVPTVRVNSNCDRNSAPSGALLNGQTCSFTCTGTRGVIYGTPRLSTATCSQGRYTGRGPLCGGQCSTINPDPMMNNCTKTYLRETFSTNTPMAELLTYDTAPTMPLRQLNETWVISGGVLTVTLPDRVDVCSPTNPTTLTLNNPPWSSATTVPPMPLNFEVTVSLGSSVASGGLAWYVQQNGFQAANMYRVMLTAGASNPTIQVAVGSTITPLTATASSTLLAATGSSTILAFTNYHLRVVVQAETFKIYLNNVLYYTLADYQLQWGHGGLHADNGVVTFDDWLITGNCDPTGNCTANEGQECVYTCMDGYTASGSATQVCDPAGTGNYLGTPFSCVPTPLVITPRGFGVQEDAILGTSLGFVVARLVNPRGGAVPVFSIVGGNNENVKNRLGISIANVTGVFAIDRYSGELTLAQEGVLSFAYGSRTFNLHIQAAISSQLTVFSQMVFSVSVGEAISAPYFFYEGASDTVYSRSVREHTIANIAFPVAAVSPDALQMTYDIIFGNHLGYFAINNATGQLSTVNTDADFYRDSVVSIVVRARLVAFPLKQDTVQVDVRLTWVNQPPRVTAGQVFTLAESRMLQTGFQIGTIAATDRDAGDIITFSLTSASTNIAVNPTTGLITVLTPKDYDPEYYPVVYSNGYACRDQIVLSLNAIDSSAAITSFNITVLALANFTATELPTFSSVTIPGGCLATNGSTIVTFNGIDMTSIQNYFYQVYVVYRTAVNDPTGPRTYNVTTACTVPKVAGVDSDTQLICRTLPGWGTTLYATIYIGYKRSAAASNSPLVLNYCPPSILCAVPTTTGYTLSTLSTAGGERVNLTVQNLGPVGTSLGIFYGPNLAYAASFVARDDTRGILTVQTVAGVGTLLPITIIVGNVIYSAQFNSLSYGAPSITRIQTVTFGMSFASLRVTGGETFQIVGSNFGPMTASPVVQYGTGAAGSNMYVNGVWTTVRLSWTMTCTRVAATAHTLMNCLTLPGTGISHSIFMNVGGQAITFSTTTLSYAAPNITAAGGIGARLADTQGGQQVILTGANLGPSTLFGDVATGYSNSVPISIRYGSAPSATAGYIAQNCLVISTNPAQISCQLAPGTGKGHSWSVTVGGQTAVTRLLNTNYAPPSLFGFDRLDGGDPQLFLTPGGQQVVINGRNFGPSIVAGRFNASYTTTLISNTDQANRNMTNNAQGNIVAYASGCTMTIPHTQLVCTMAEGAGNSASWSIVVDGQSSSLPATGYGPPAIENITVIDNSTGAFKPYASTDGGDILFVTGSNFGPATNCQPGALVQGRPRCYGFVQSLSYGPTGNEYTPLDFTVVDSTTLLIVTAPGFGLGCNVIITVADQPSQVSVNTFDYEMPTVDFIDPAVSPTDTSGTKQVLVKVYGRGFALLDSTSTNYILFGNPNDRTLQVDPLTPIAAYPDTGNAAQLASYVRGSQQWLQFSVPIGLLPNRAVRVSTVSRDNPSGSALVSDPVADAARGSSPYLSYVTPDMDNVIVALPPVNNVNLRIWLLTNLPQSIFAQAYQLIIIGANFGPNATVTSDNVRREVQYSSDGGVTWDSLSVLIWTWDHNKIVAYTMQSSGALRIVHTGTAFSGAVSNATSLPQEYLNLSPSVSSLVGISPTTLFSTAGGDVVGINVFNLNAQTSVTIKIGDRPTIYTAVITDDFGAPITNVINTVVNDVTGKYLKGVAPNQYWVVYFKMPPGEGINLPVYIFRDNSQSETQVYVSYAPPAISSFSVLDPLTGQATVQTVTSNSIIYVPTEPTTLTLTGTNFGVCPKVQLPSGFAYFGPNSPTATGPACATTTEGSSTSTQIVLTTRVGESTGVTSSAPLGYTLMLSVGGQATTPIKFRFLAPTIYSVTPTGPTSGGTPLVITGINFGSPSAISRTTIILADSVGTLTCGRPVRINVTSISCTLPEGAGSGMDVRLTVVDQTAVAPRAFSYLPPHIDSILFDGVQAAAFGVESYRSRLTMPSAGNVTVTLRGSNFGRAGPTNCLFVAWRGRQPTDSFACNTRLDFIGEGEVPNFVISSWTHTNITFVYPPGQGIREIIPMVRGQMPLVPTVAYYRGPVLTARPNPPNGDTSGGMIVALAGMDLGIPQDYAFNDSAALAAKMTTLPSTLDDYLVLTPYAEPPFTPSRLPLPTSSFRIDIMYTTFSTCLSSDLSWSTAGALVQPPQLSGCSPAVITQTQDEVEFVIPPGIGANRSITVTVLDWDVMPDGSLKLLNFTSQPVFFSYNPPLIRDTTPKPVLLDGKDGKSMIFYGKNFGVADPRWTPEEKSVVITIGGVECDAEDRVTRQGTTALQCSMPNIVVGHQNISYSVAGQKAFNSASDTGSAFFGCAKNYFGYDGETCLQCPRGAYCRGFDPNLQKPNTTSIADGGSHTYPRPLNGYFNLNSTNNMIAACPPSGIIPGRDLCVVACQPVEACCNLATASSQLDGQKYCVQGEGIGDNICAYGYESREPLYRCAYCAKGFYRQGNGCVKCPDSPYAVIIVAALLLIGLGSLSWILNKKKINIGYISIAVDYFQVLAIFAQSKIPWPPALKALFHILSAFSLNIEIVAPECLVPNVSFRQKWAFVVALPIGVTVAFAALHYSLVLYKYCCKGRSKSKLNNHVGSLISSIFMLYYLLYIYLCKTILDVFNCAPTEPPEYSDPPANTKMISYMAAVFEPCGVAGSTQQILLPWAAVAVVVYMVGYPAIVAAIVYRNRRFIMLDQLLRAKGTGNDKTTGAEPYEMRKRYRNLYYQFRPDMVFWILAILGRKLALAVTYVIFNRNASFQLAAALLVIFLAYAAQVRFLPYMSPGEYDKVLRDLEDKAKTKPFYEELQRQLAHVQSRTKKRTYRNLLNPEGKVELSALLSILSSNLFSYNVVEAVMLFCAFIVSLMGIMFAAQANAPGVYSSARDACTGVAMAFGILGVVYVFFVIITEIIVLLQATSEKAKKASSLNRRKSGAGKDAKEMVLGAVTENLNPYLTKGNKGKDKAATDELMQMFCKMESFPNKDQQMWDEFKSAFMSLQDEVKRLSTLIADAKYEQQRVDEAAKVVAETKAGLQSMNRKKATFGPSMTEDASGGAKAAGDEPSAAQEKNPLRRAKSMTAMSGTAGRAQSLSLANARKRGAPKKSSAEDDE